MASGEWIGCFGLTEPDYGSNPGDMITKAEDMGEFYRIPSDNRDLNYNKYFYEGEKDISIIEDYNSHNTDQCDIENMKNLLMGLSIIKDEVIKYKK